MTQISFIIQWGFTFSFFVVMLLRISFQTKSKLFDRWHLISKWIVLSFLVLVAIENIIIFVGIVSKAKQKHEGYSFYYSRINVFSAYGWSFYFGTFSPLALCLAFAFKKLRDSFLWSLAAVFLFNAEYIIILITGLYRDYLPSSWSVSYDLLPGNDYFLSFILFNFTVLLIILLNNVIPKSVTHE